MPTNHTPNYQLSQWVRSDKVLMEDFNADNTKIDAAIKAVDTKASTLAGSKADQTALEAEIAARKSADGALNTTLSAHAQAMTKLGNCQIYSLRYTGNSSAQTLTFPEQPTVVFLVQTGGPIALCVYGAEQSRSIGTSDTSSFWITWSGNTLSWTDYMMNMNNAHYYAIAFCGRS